MIDDLMDVVENPSKREKLALVMYFVVMVILATPLTRMAGFAWEKEGLMYMSIMSLTEILGLTLEAFSIMFFGVVAGLVALLVVDAKKRWQGVLLSVGVVGSLLVLASLGLFVPVVEFIPNLHWLLLGVLVGTSPGVISFLRQLDSSQAYEFRGAAWALFGLFTVIVAASHLEFHLIYMDGDLAFEAEDILLSTTSSVVFLFALYRFVQYDAGTDLLVLGPRQSGKSLLLVGAFLEAKNRQEDRNKFSKTPLNPSSALMEHLRQLDQPEEGWGVQATDQPRELSFRYVHGSVFPKNMELTTYDYPGELLPKLTKGSSDRSGAGESGAFADGGRRDRQSTYEYTYETEQDEGHEYGESGQESGSRSYLGGGSEDAADKLAEKTVESDTLVFVIDVEKYKNSKDMGLEHYFDIIRDVDDKRFVPVATKCDYFIEGFIDKHDCFPTEEFSSFKDYVNQKLQANEQISTLVLETGGDDIQPVFYQTKTNDSGEKVPLRDDAGSVETVGFDYLLDRLGG